MSPALLPGDRLRIEPFGNVAPTPGEVVVALRGEVLVAHRLMSWDGRMAVTRGDAVPMNDPALECDKFLGRVVEIERGGYKLRPPAHPITQHLRRALARWVRPVLGAWALGDRR
jgi:hypothetical protein